MGSASKPDDCTFLVSYDLDDQTMNPAIIRSAQAIHKNVVCYGGNSMNKIEAINADIEKVPVWEIVLVISDDFFCGRVGWDDVIRKEMTAHFTDTNGFLWFHDGTKQNDICTLPIMGRKLYEKFGYIYNPEYKSFFCDNEQSEVVQSMGLCKKLPYSIASHQHPAWNGGMKPDALYRKNNVYWNQDKATYHRRKALGFPR